MFYLKRVNEDGTYCIVDTSDNSHDDCTKEDVLEFKQIGIQVIGLKFIGNSFGRLYETLFNIGNSVYGVLPSQYAIEKITMTSQKDYETDEYLLSKSKVAGKLSIDTKTKQMEVMSMLELDNGKYLLNFGELYKDMDSTVRVKSTVYLFDTRINYIKKIIASKFLSFPSHVLPQLTKTKSGVVYFGKKALEFNKL